MNSRLDKFGLFGYIIEVFYIKGGFDMGSSESKATQKEVLRK